MKKITFIKEPGRMYDLFFPFALHFNHEYFLTDMINHCISAEDTKFFNQIHKEFDDIPHELLPFFYIKKRKARTFMTPTFFDPYDYLFPTSYSLETVQTALMDHDDVITKLLKFYFQDIDEATLADCKTSLRTVGRMINASPYNDTVKSSLYAFFLDPDLIINKLSYELMVKNYQITHLHQTRAKKLLEVQNQFDFEALASKLKLCDPHPCDLYRFQEIYVTFCLICKNCIKVCFHGDMAVLILGFDYLRELEDILPPNVVPQLYVFAGALADKNRMDILELIYRNQEITIRDIEQELGLTGTNAYYHLSLMLKANIITSRSQGGQGRTVFYRVNKHYFSIIRDMMDRYAN